MRIIHLTKSVNAAKCFVLVVDKDKSIPLFKTDSITDSNMF